MSKLPLCLEQLNVTRFFILFFWSLDLMEVAGFILWLKRETNKEVEREESEMNKKKLSTVGFEVKIKKCDVGLGEL